MRSLRDRLAQFDAAKAPVLRRPDVEGDRIAALADLLTKGARWVGGPPDGYIVVEESLVLPPRSRVGASFWSRAGLPKPQDDGPWMVFDTETTGLESGTGTVVFLVALLYWAEDSAWLVQYFLPEPAGEVKFWTEVGQAIESCSLLISYNGKSFDVPRIRSRMHLSRLDSACLDVPHADLLHPTRRVVRNWLDSCRLVEVERGLLGLRRDGDLPGSQAPEVYRALQVEGVDQGLCEVLRHNRNDVVNLVDLTLRLSEILCDGGWRQLPDAARLDVARAMVRRGDEPLALDILVSLRGVESRELRARARTLAAHVQRRCGAHLDAEVEFLAALEANPSGVDTRVQLAKLYEHCLRDVGRAHDMTLRALSDLTRRREWGDVGDEGERGRDALVHRLRRLERKMRTI